MYMMENYNFISSVNEKENNHNIMMMENEVVDKDLWSDHKTIDQIYNECLEHLKNIKIFAKKQSFPTSIENIDKESIINADRLEPNEKVNDVEKGDSYILDSIRRSNEKYMPIVYNKPKTKLKRSLSENSGNRKIRARRLITKTGVRNIALITNIRQHSRRFLSDVFTTLIESRWRWIMFWAVAGHFIFWLAFAVLWYLTGLAHYDFEENPPKRLCVTGGHSFLAIFLASMEAQTTLGYGDRTIDETCPESIFILMMNLIVGTALTGALTSVFFSKLTRPEKMAKEGVGFSKNAAISLRDGDLCLMFRVWDTNHFHIVKTDISAHIVTARRTREGELLKYHTQELKLKESNVFMMWPTIIIHVIDESSPFYDMGAKDFLESPFEIAVTLRGASHSTGTFAQSLASYLPKEIIWGYRFKNVLGYSDHHNQFVIDYKNLDGFDQIDTPLCSAKKLHEVCQDLGMKSVDKSSLRDSSSNWSGRDSHRNRSLKKKLCHTGLSMSQKSKINNIMKNVKLSIIFK